MTQPLLVNREQACVVLGGIGMGTLRGLLRSGVLAEVAVGRLRLIRVRDLEAYADGLEPCRTPDTGSS